MSAAIGHTVWEPVTINNCQIVDETSTYKCKYCQSNLIYEQVSSLRLLIYCTTKSSMSPYNTRPGNKTSRPGLPDLPPQKPQASSKGVGVANSDPARRLVARLQEANRIKASKRQEEGLLLPPGIRKYSPRFGTGKFRPYFYAKRLLISQQIKLGTLLSSLAIPRQLVEFASLSQIQMKVKGAKQDRPIPIAVSKKKAGAKAKTKLILEQQMSSEVLATKTKLKLEQQTSDERLAIDPKMKQKGGASKMHAQADL
jgi:hypothetical protein